ncbi:MULTISPECIES: response regulator transcription factor [Flavobacterium]|uniref:DNA-binding NarL/FixJ family response regulator n=2 Tax=Flavobacterium TaxID=237 RepID=A0A562KB48_9FLAO|nr:MULTISPECIES: response regulator transcription factor [Flavobacterium]MCW1147272.1 response regulator transcription factor [Flavobacterium lacisediminis]TDR24074.1 LuxR family two component transcriptional regulator [Flavobacterium cheniae]TWH92638.1 DNA-binding NarL/FixJ family response regulator [Flavobacterium cheniae]
MIKICIADSLPVVSQGLQSYFQGNTRMEIVASAKNLESLLNVLNNKRCDILLLDVELEGLSSIRDIKSLLKDFPETKIVLFTNVSEQMYAPTAIKAGVSAYVSKRSDLKELEATIAKVSEGKVVFSETVKKSIEMLSKGKKSERLFKKLSTREIEVLRYLNDGKKNKEVAQILGLDEKTISTYKLRLLAKLNVTNLVDLLKKAKDLDVI